MIYAGSLTTILYNVPCKHFKIMAKKIKLELTERQFEALIDTIDNTSAQIGCGDHDDVWLKNIKLIDRMLLKNGYKRKHK